MPRDKTGRLIQGGMDSKFNICSAGSSSSYMDTEDEVREIARTSGVRFVTTGYSDDEDIYEGHPQFRGIEGTLRTRRTDGSVDLFELFRDDPDFAGFLPVTHTELRVALDALKAHREKETA